MIPVILKRNGTEGKVSVSSKRRMMRMFQHAMVWLYRSRLKMVMPALVVTTLLCGALLMDKTRPSSAKPAWLEFKSCSPRTNIAFLKTHKCASSAVQNILFRYGDKHNLTFALPDMGNHFGSGRQEFKADMVLSSPLNKITPNIFAIHTKWNHAEVKKVMPEDTLYFTAVREPTAQFQSLFDFSDMGKSVTLDEYVREVAMDGERTNGYLGYNQMMWDLGMTLQDMTNLTAARELVMRADDQFGLVLVAERMDESLVLLAKYLCWELSDVLVLNINSMRKEFKTTLTEDTRRVLQQKLSLDYLLYNHFLERLDQQVEAFGRGRMAAAVSRLREMKGLLVNTCNFVRKEAKELTGKKKPWSDKVDGFVEGGGGGGGCGVYTLTELNYLDLLRNRQRKKIAKMFGLPPAPPMDAIPLGINNIGKLNLNNLRRRKKTLPHKINFKNNDRKTTRAGGS